LKYELNYESSAAFARQVYRQLLWRSRGEFIVLSVAIAAIAVWYIPSRSNDALVGFAIGVVACWWYAWWADGQSMVRDVNRLQDKTIQVVLDEQGCRVSSREATTHFTWSSVAEVYRLRSALVLVRHVTGTGAVLPMHVMSPESLTDVETWSRNGGARIR
jgi:hypothetical protein